MTFYLTYELDFKRVMSAVINDARNTIQATTNQPGTVIYGYVQAKIGQITPSTLVYRIVTDMGNLAGFCAIQIQNQTATLLLYQLRPAYQSFSAQILQIITNFIISNVYLQDTIY